MYHNDLCDSVKTVSLEKSDSQVICKNAPGQ